MLFIFFALPLLAALLCMALNRLVPTRWLGVGGALALAAALSVLLFAAQQNALSLPEYTWVSLDENPVQLAVRFDNANLPLALVVAGGGALALLGLALSLPARLRGFGGLFSALLLLFLTVLGGLAVAEPLLTPFALALATLLSFVALRASGIQFVSSGLPAGLLAGLLAALALSGAALVERGAVVGAPPTPIVLVCWTLAALLTLGAPPFHAAFDETTEAPAGLAGALLALGVPLLGGASLLRFVAARVADDAAWRVVLLALGLLTTLVCAAGALRERRLRRLLGWQFSAQMGVFLVALGLPQNATAIVAPALLCNAALTTLAGYLAGILLERRAGTDDLSQIGRAEPLPGAGLALLIAAASAVGLPGTWGFWERTWLFERLRVLHPWTIAPSLAASALLALAFVAPLLAFWRAAKGEAEEATGRTWAAGGVQFSALVVALPLVALGLVPQLRETLFHSIAQADATLGTVIGVPDPATQITGGAVLLALVLLPVLLRRASRRVVVDPETHSATMTPDGLAESLGWLAWLGAPNGLFNSAWQSLQTGARWLRRGLALFEQRYYLAGLMLAVVAVVLLLL